MTDGDSVGPAISGLQQGYAWLAAAMANASDHIALILAAAGAGAGAAALAWAITGGLVVGVAFKFRSVFFYGFVFLVAFVVVAGLGVKVWG